LIFIDNKLPDDKLPATLKLSVVISSILIEFSGKVGKVARKTINASHLFSHSMIFLTLMMK
jgi:hypothetical protein